MPIDTDFEMSKDTWRIFRIISEFVDGFEVMGGVEPGVSVFGSARTPPDSPVYSQAIECGRRLARAGFSTITGGGPGVMEAANKGAYEAEGVSVGLNITLPMEQEPNEYQTHGIAFRYFFVRKVMFVKYARAFIIFPGGFGTMDEFFESMTLLQTLKIKPFPVILIGSHFWSGLVDWMKNVLVEQYQTIAPEDIEWFRVTDDVAEAVELIRQCYERGVSFGPGAKQPPDFAAEPTGEGTVEGVDPRTNQQGARGRRPSRGERRELPKYPPDPRSGRN